MHTTCARCLLRILKAAVRTIAKYSSLGLSVIHLDFVLGVVGEAQSTAGFETLALVCARRASDPVRQTFKAQRQPTCTSCPGRLVTVEICCRRCCGHHLRDPLPALCVSAHGHKQSWLHIRAHCDHLVCGQRHDQPLQHCYLLPW